MRTESLNHLFALKKEHPKTSSLESIEEKGYQELVCSTFCVLSVFISRRFAVLNSF
jgi:hypothetical protein